MTVANVNVTKVLHKRGNTVQNNNYTGVAGEITIDTQAKTLRIHDGTTVGGNIITAGGVIGSYSNVNTAAYIPTDSTITSLQSNAASQATSINTISANLGAFQSYANITLSTIANASGQQTSIDSINANIIAANSAITSLQSNAAIQAALLDTLTGNAATQSSVLDTLTSNAASQATTLTTLLSNAVAQQSSLETLVGNAASQATTLNSKANISGASFTGNVTVPYLIANNQVHINDHLLVGTEHDQGTPFLNPAALFFGNTYSSVSDKYFQLILQNSDPNGSGDIVVTADDGNDGSNYITMGINGSTYSDPSFPSGPGNNPHDGYLYMTGGNLVVAGGSDLFVASGTTANLHLIGGASSNAIIVSDNTNGSWNIGGNLVPNANVTYSLGSSTRQWRDLWVSNNTIYIGNTPIRVDGGTLLVNGTPVSGGSTYGNANVAAYLPTYTGNIAGNIVKNGYTWTFGTDGTLTVPANGIITAPINQEFQLQAKDANSVLRNEINLDPNNGTYMSVWSDGTTSFSSADWDTGSWNNESGLGAARFTDAQALQNFWTTGPGSLGLPIEASINGGARTPNVFYENNNGETYGVYLGLDAVPPGGQGTTVPITSLVFYYQTQSKINIDRDGGEILLDAQSMDLDLRTTNILDLRAGENLNLRGLGQYPVRIYTNNSTHMWEFDTSGSLTLPSEGKINGIGAPNDRLGYMSWAGNTSGDGQGWNTMRLVPDQQGLEDLDTYIILDPAYVDGPGSIHIRAGGTRDNSLANLYLGGANSHVKIGTGSNPPVTVMANNKSWTFSNTGTTTFPTGVTLSNARGANTVNFLTGVDKSFQIETQTNATSKLWNFTTDGNLTLPQNANINFANGVSILAGITGTYGNANVAAYLPTYTGNIAGNIVKNGNVWTFGTNGTTRFPDGTILAPAGQSITMQSDQYAQLMWQNANVTVAPDMAINSNFYVAQNNATLDIVYRDGSSNQQQKSWLWNIDGMTLPAGGTITEGGGISGAIRLTPAGGANSNQALLIYPTAGAPEGDHVHLTTGGGSTELYLGNDFHYVKLVDGGNIELRAATANLSSQAAWTFDTTGNVDTIQALGIKVPNGVPSNVAVINSTTGSWEANPRSNLATTGGSGSGLTVNVTETGGYASTIAIATAGTGYTNGDLITVTSGSSNATFTIVIGGRNIWRFGTNGALTFPDATVQSTAWTGILPSPTYSGSDAIGNVPPAPLNLNNTGTSGELKTQLTLINTAGGGGTGSAIDFFTYTDVGNGFPGARIQSIDDSNYSADLSIILKEPGSGDNTDGATWAFGANANLTLPETGYLRVGSGIVAGFASSPAPVISGFSSVSAENFRFQGNGVNILSTVGAGSYGNTQVATYLLNFDGDIEFTSSTARIGNVDVITVMDSIRSPAYQFSNGASILSNVVSKTTGSWTVTTGTNTYSIQLAENGTYQIWVDCNIPNGILAYNATATVTNGNVPVVGVQYAWVYNGGGTPIDFVSIPNQFVGTANTIVRSSVAPSATTNRFDFGINNTSGGNVTVRYGYVKIS
jgi:hypothetical protein